MSKMKKNTKMAKDEVINVRLTRPQKETLQVIAAREGVALSTWILQAALSKAFSAGQTSER